MNIPVDMEQAVLDRYADAAQEREAALCCPVSYDAKYLDAIPAEILERDYGCGDPSRFLRRGDTALDLGCGGGKICYIASQIVGPEGQVIGVDFNLPMLDLARRHQDAVGDWIGWRNTTFLRGRIQDLRTDYDRLEARLAQRPLATIEDFLAFESETRALAETEPMIADESIDVIVSNCVLNLVRAEDKGALFAEMKRVLNRGGRVAISDIVADEPVPEHIRADAELWSGCIAGAFQEQDFLAAFEAAGFHGVEIAQRDAEPWRVIDGIEFRSMTVTAWKGKEGPCLERSQAVIYRGPWREVHDDDGHVFRRGVPTAVCDKTFRLLTAEPYGEAVIPVPPRVEVPLDQAATFDCHRSATRHPRETKGTDYRETRTDTESCCAPDSGCC